MKPSREKRFFTMRVASSLTGLHPQTIRGYEAKGLIHPARTKGNTRLYSESDLDDLIEIANLSRKGVGLEGIKIILEMESEIQELNEKVDSLLDQNAMLEESLANVTSLHCPIGVPPSPAPILALDGKNQSIVLVQHRG